MRKIYVSFLSFFLFITFISRLNAQTAGTYVFSPSAGTYAPLTGTTTSTATGDDGTQNVAIGFNFVFGGISYTNVVISTNGAVRLVADGTTGFATSWFNNLNDTYNAAILAPMWDDNNATGGSVVYLATGTAPNRTFSVEWINIHLGGGGDATAPTGTFQLTLTESSNTINFLYGTINPLLVSTISIGLNDLTSFLSVTPGAPATASSATADNGITSAINLTSGTTYNFFSPPPCVAPPGGGTAQSSVASACAGTPFNLTVTGASFGTGLTYLWETSPNGLAPWTSTSVTTAAYTVPNQTAATYYRRKITCSGQDGFSTALLIGQNTPANCYCIPAFPNAVEPITLVNFSNISNATSATVNGTPALENFTSIAGNVSKGQPYIMTVKGNTAGNYTTPVDVYIDWNQDGDLTDAGESFFIGTITNSTGLDAIQATAIIVIPATALDGNTRMRVMKRFSVSALPCNTNGYGQAEDYTLNITTPVCSAPSAISVGAIDINSAVITFTSGGGTAYVEYGLVGFNPGAGATAGGGTVITPATSPLTITGLSANTFYDVYVRRDCGGGIFSGNAPSGSFRTLCLATNLPYTQNFDAATPPAIPACTSIQDLNGAPTWITTSPPAAWGFEGKALRYLYDAAKPANDWFFTQGLNLTAGTLYEISFKYGATDPEYPESMKVAFGTSAVNTSMVNTIVDFPTIVANSAAPFATKARYSFTPTTTGINYIGFQVYSLADEFQLFLDSIHVKAVPLADVGISGLTLPALNCPTSGVFLQATVKNYNLIPINFATNPVTVTANITGAATATLSTVLNAGTLAAGASMSVYLNPVFNFSAGGIYNITTATISPDDTETGNNALVTSVNVNPNPPTPVITPASAQLCLGSQVQLSTQFTVSPPVITWTPVTGLFTNATATTAYVAGANAYSVYSKPAATGTYVYTVTATAAGCTSSATATVTVNAPSLITIGSIPDTVCISDQVVPLVTSPVGGSWSGIGVSGNNFIPPATAVGTYTLTYTYANSFGCTSTVTKRIAVKDCPERIILLRDNAVILYPNPNNGLFNIRINSVLYNNLIMKVYTNNGVLVRTQQLSGLAYSRVVPVDLTNLPGGAYMVHFYYQGGVRTSEKTFRVIIGHK